MGVILLATAYVAVIYALFGALGKSWHLPTAIACYLVWIGGCQALLGRLISPRVVSAVAGGVATVVWTLWLTYDRAHYPAFSGALIPAFMVGMLFGYCAGAIVASLFLIHDAIGASLGARRREREALRAAMGETPSESPFDD